MPPYPYALPLAALALLASGCSTNGTDAETSTGPNGQETPSAPTTPTVPYAFDPKPAAPDGHFSLVRPDGSEQRLARGPMSDFVVTGTRVVRSYGTETTATPRRSVCS